MIILMHLKYDGKQDYKEQNEDVVPPAIKEWFIHESLVKTLYTAGS